MGVIQGSLNQLAGTALGAAGTGMVAKKISEDLKEKKEKEVENAYNTLSSSAKDSIELAKEFSDISAKGKQAEKDLKTLGEIRDTPGAIRSEKDEEAYAELYEQADNDLTAAFVAMKALKNKKTAIRMRVDRSQSILRKAGLLGGNK